MPLTSPGIPRSLRSRPFRPRRKGLGFLRCGDWRCLPLVRPGHPPLAALAAPLRCAKGAGVPACAGMRGEERG